MRITHRRQSVTALLIISLCAAPLARLQAQERLVPSTNDRRVLDVALTPQGSLAGLILDGSGQPVAHQPVVAEPVAGQPHAVVSDAAGRFSIAGLRGGVYRVSAAGTSLACRCWTAGTAPPAAGEQVLLVADEEIQRGQRPIGDLLGGPVLLALIIAAAIAIPIAVHNSQKKDAS